MVAGVVDTLRDMEWIAGLVEAAAPKPEPRGPYKKMQRGRGVKNGQLFSLPGPTSSGRSARAYEEHSREKASTKERAEETLLAAGLR
jgi:hypothetical protein